MSQSTPADTGRKMNDTELHAMLDKELRRIFATQASAATDYDYQATTRAAAASAAADTARALIELDRYKPEVK